MELGDDPFTADWPIAVEWAVNHLRETGQLIEWHPYPETKPEKEGYYLITLRRDDALVMSIYFINRFPVGTTAWAHMPAPAKKSER